MAFKDVVGHKRPIKLLTLSLRAGRIASSYIFAGESGIGKKFTALNFAKVLNCQEGGDSAGSCDKCLSCRKINSGVHPDVMVVAPESSEIKVEQIRDIEDALHLKPHEAKTKVVIVDDAETMNEAASNAFLKTLEEPPPQSLIILVTSRPDGLLETIRSRCMRINFKPLTPSDCEAVISKEMPGGYSKDIVRLSMGRPGNAIGGEFVEERARFIALLKEVRPGTKALWKDRADTERWFDMLFCFLRDIVVLKTTGDHDGLINKDLEPFVRQGARDTDMKALMDCYGKLLMLRHHLRFNLNKGITWNYTGAILWESLAPSLSARPAGGSLMEKR